jgi:signal transduction histidine kinase
MADTIAAQVEALRRTDEERRTLVAQVSHDFRTPLTSIRGHAERMLTQRNGTHDDEDRRRLEMVVQNADRLERLADQLHELSRLDAQGASLDVERFSIAELVQDLVLKFQPQAEDQGIELTAEVSADVPTVDGDIALVERLLSNLIDNALANTPAGGTVRIGLAERSGAVRIAVTDTGVGIPETEIPLVTQRFYQVDREEDSDEEASDGSGLGLAIAAEIAESHGSGLVLQSEEGEGTTIAFHLPTANGRRDRDA